MPEIWDDILKTGTFIDANGKKIEITLADLNHMVESFDPKKRDVPLVIGHPKTNAPAWGWVNQLRVNDNKLQAQYKDIVNEIKPVLALKQYRKKSVSLYPDKTLRHVGLLGAVQPAIPGLRDFQFSDSDTAIIYIEFKEGHLMDEDKEKDKQNTINRLRAQLEDKESKLRERDKQISDQSEQLKKMTVEFSEFKQAHRKNEIATWVDRMIEKGKALPSWKEQGVIEFVQGLDQEPMIEFSDRKTSQVKWFMDFVEKNFKTQDMFMEMSKNEEHQQTDRTGLTGCV